MIEILSWILGPLENNVFLLVEPESHSAVVIDPGFEGETIITEIRQRELSLQAIWITHAHFDHFAGVNPLLSALAQPVPVGLHPADLPAWRTRGGADYFGVRLDPPPLPNLEFEHGQILTVGNSRVEVRHAPGHSAGHVMFYLPENKALICGDVIFQGSIGRTDLADGNFGLLIQSIQAQVLTLPDETVLLPGHGPATTVGAERRNNPFL